MTAWIDWRTEPIMDVPEIEEYVGATEWSLTCTASDCNWTSWGERSVDNWMQEMHEDIDAHRDWHENGMPQ